MIYLHRFRSLLVGCLLSFSFAVYAQSTSEGQTELAKQMAKGVRLQQQITENFLAISQLKGDICEGFRDYLPQGDSPFAAYQWECHYTDGIIRYTVRDERNLQVASVQILYYPQGVTSAARSMNGTCAGLPAMRKKDRQVWVLIGEHVELRVEAKADALQSDETLESFVRAFDLAGLAQL